MKANKLMLTMALAASALVACNKQETTPVQFEEGNKSVTLSIANLFETKGTGTQVAEGTAVQLNSFQVFFADAAGALYSPKTVNAAANATTYFTQKEADNLYEFHFLPKAVSKVIVVGNMPEQTVTTEAALLAAVKDLNVADQQNPAALRLYGVDATLSASTTNHATADNAAIQHPNPYVHADVNLVPTVARFEVTGFEYAQVAENTARNYSEMVVNNLSVRNWFTTATVALDGTVTPGAAKDAFAGVTLDKNNIYGTYFTQLTSAWSNDTVGATLNAANTYKVAETANCYAYHVFPGAVPQFLMSLTGKEGGVSSPLYLATSALKAGENAIETIGAGKVYRMAMKFNDNNLQQPEKCVEVAISVDDWNVIVVTPEF